MLRCYAVTLCMVPAYSSSDIDVLIKEKEEDMSLRTSSSPMLYALD